MRPPPLTFRAQPTLSTAFCDDPWPGDESYSPCSSSRSGSSSRTSSSSSSHVLPESAFMGSDGRYLIDPYLGRQDIAELCAGYLKKEFHSMEESSTSKRLGQPKLSVFIAQTIYLTGAPYNAVISALILLQRFRAKLSASAGEDLGLSGHMLWLGAFLIACSQDSMVKYINEARSATYWSEMTLFSEREVDEVYREMWDELEGNVTVFPSYASALEKLKNPIKVPPSWEAEHLWTFDEDEDDAYSSSCSDVGLADSREQRCRSDTQDSDKARSNLSPKGKPKNKGGNTSPASSRTRAVGSRLVSLFKKKA